ATKTASTGARQASTCAASRRRACSRWVRTAGSRRPSRPAPPRWNCRENGMAAGPLPASRLPGRDRIFCTAAISAKGLSQRMFLYQYHELGRAMTAPLTYWAEANAKVFSASSSFLSSLPGSERVAAANELFYRVGKDYEKPE